MKFRPVRNLTQSSLRSPLVGYLSWLGFSAFCLVAKSDTGPSGGRHHTSWSCATDATGWVRAAATIKIIFYTARLTKTSGAQQFSDQNPWNPKALYLLNVRQHPRRLVVHNLCFFSDWFSCSWLWEQWRWVAQTFFRLVVEYKSSRSQRWRKGKRRRRGSLSIVRCA